jgi:hypothetical protein
MTEPLRPPAAIAMGDQMHATMFDQARTSVDGVLAAEGIEPSEDNRLHVEIGIGAGIHAAMRVLVDMGLLAAAAP